MCLKRNTCNYSRPTWKPTSRTMVTKMSWITSWVHLHSLWWTQCKRWIPIRSMGCVHTHQRIPASEGWGSPSHIQSAMEKTGEASQKLGKIGWTISQTFVLGSEHDRIWAWWASNIPSGSMLESVWWCKCFEMEPWSQTICCPMSFSNKRKHARARGGRISHAILRCCWKRKMLLSTCVKTSKRKGH
jgi:hypothetical protein